MAPIPKHFSRTGLERLYQLGNGDIPRKPGEQMNVIFSSADLQRLTLKIPQNRGQVRVNLASQNGRLQEPSTVLRRENNMDEHHAEEADNPGVR